MPKYQCRYINVLFFVHLYWDTSAIVPNADYIFITKTKRAKFILINWCSVQQRCNLIGSSSVCKSRIFQAVLTSIALKTFKENILNQSFKIFDIIFKHLDSFYWSIAWSMQENTWTSASCMDTTFAVLSVLDAFWSVYVQALTLQSFNNCIVLRSCHKKEVEFQAFLIWDSPKNTLYWTTEDFGEIEYETSSL